jgi:hypothetical protein
LRAELEEETVAGEGLNDAAWTDRGFYEFRVNAGFAEGISAD